MPASEKTNVNSGRLDKLEDHAVRTEDRLNNIEKTQESHGGKLDSIGISIQALSTQLIRYDSKPTFDAHKAISTVRDVFAICSVMAALAVWLVLTLTASNDRIAELEMRHQAEKIAWLESKLNFVARIETIKP